MEDLQGRTSPAGAAEEGLTRAERLSYAQQREGIGAPGTQRQHKQYGDVFIDYWVLIFKIAWIGPMTVVTAARFMAELVRGHHVAVQQGEGAPPPGARRALKWPRLLTPAWLKSMHQSLLAQYKLDLAASGVDGLKSLDADPAYNNIHATAQALAKGQKGIHHTADPQASSALDKFSYDQYKQICTHLWKEICTSTTLNYMATNINTKFLMNFLWSVCGRSDHSLLITLACCCAPKCFDNAGPSEAWCYDFVVKCDKTHSSRELHIMQHVDVTMCPVYMLILYLVMTYTIQREPLPCPFKDFKSWLNTRIFTEVPLDGRKDPNAVYKDLKRAYLHQNRVVARVFQALGIFTSKVVHAFRHSAAGHLGQVVGAAKEDIDRFGGWCDTVSSVFYLKNQVPAIMQALAGVTGIPYHELNGGGFYFSERFHLKLDAKLVREQLQLIIFPFITQLQRSVELIKAAGLAKDRLSALNFLELLDHLTFVAVRGAVANAKQNPHDPLVVLLSTNAYFNSLVEEYHAKLQAGFWEHLRPKTHAQHMSSSRRRITELQERLGMDIVSPPRAAKRQCTTWAESDEGQAAATWQQQGPAPTPAWQQQGPSPPAPTWQQQGPVPAPAWQLPGPSPPAHTWQQQGPAPAPAWQLPGPSPPAHPWQQQGPSPFAPTWQQQGVAPAPAWQLPGPSPPAPTWQQQGVAPAPALPLPGPSQSQPASRRPKLPCFYTGDLVEQVLTEYHHGLLGGVPLSKKEFPDGYKLGATPDTAWREGQRKAWYLNWLVIRYCMDLAEAANLQPTAVKQVVGLLQAEGCLKTRYQMSQWVKSEEAKALLLRVAANAAQGRGTRVQPAAPERGGQAEVRVQPAAPGRGGQAGPRVQPAAQAPGVQAGPRVQPAAQAPGGQAGPRVQPAAQAPVAQVALPAPIVQPAQVAGSPAAVLQALQGPQGAVLLAFLQSQPIALRGQILAQLLAGQRQ